MGASRRSHIEMLESTPGSRHDRTDPMPCTRSRHCSQIARIGASGATARMQRAPDRIAAGQGLGVLLRSGVSDGT